jgi:MinD-like ATPase involved in chromosome partitioning or flagellar assembly
VLISLISAKGSPGVTAAAASLAAAARATVGDALLVELDPSGGDIEVLSGVTGEPGLLRVANDLRRHVDPQVLPGYAAPAPTGLSSILAPSSGPATASLIDSIAERIGSAFSQLDVPVVLDGGRWSASQPSARRITGSDVVLLVCRPTATSVEHARHVLDRVRPLHREVAVLLVGDRPYGAEEVAAVLETPVVGALAWDPGGVAALWSDGISKHWQRGWLARSARTVFEAIGVDRRAEVLS